MVFQGKITRIEERKVWVAVSPEGGNCADCSCEKPVRTLLAQLDEGQEAELGDTCLVKSAPYWALGSAILLSGLSFAGFFSAWQFFSQASESQRAGLALAGLALGLLVGIVIMAPFRSKQIARAQLIRLHYIPAGSSLE